MTTTVEPAAIIITTEAYVIPTDSPAWTNADVGDIARELVTNLRETHSPGFISLAVRRSSAGDMLAVRVKLTIPLTS